MNKITYRASRLSLLLLAAGALLYAGCNSVPKVSSPEAGYLVSRYWVEVKGDSDQVSAMNAYARTLAEAKLHTLAGGGNLPALRRHLRDLQTPVMVNPRALDSEPKVSNSKRRAISDWLQSNPQNDAFDGAKASEEWQQELTRTEQRTRLMSTQFAAALAQARQDAAAGNFEAAAKEVQTARDLDPEDDAVQAAHRDIFQNWANSRCGKLLSDLRDICASVGTLARNYESDRFSPAQIAECENRLNEGQLQVDTLRAWCAQDADTRPVLAQRESELQQAEAQLFGLRGTGWAQRMWLSRRLHHYWDAYQQFIADTAVKELDLSGGQKHVLQDREIIATHAPVIQAYERMLAEGMDFYLKNAAAAAEGQGANGLSLVLCRMAQELLEYAESQKMTLAPEVEPERAALNASLNNAQKSLKNAMARQLVIRDFQSRGDLGQVLAGQIYDEWLKRYAADVPADKPVPFWMLEVARDTDKTNTYDYILSGSVKQCYADTLPPKELNVERLEIGQEPQAIPNPDPKLAKKNPTIFEQELWIYERRTSEIAKRAVIRADVAVTFDGKVQPCTHIDQEFDGVKTQLPNNKLVDTTIENRALNFKTKRADYASDLAVKKLPSDRSGELSSDREIEAALINFGRDQVLTNLEVFAALFPLNNLLDNAVRNASDPIKASEWYGECVEYCSQLAALDKQLAGRTGRNWIDWRQATAERIASIKQDQWLKADPALKAQVDHLWELAVASAIQAADQMSHSE
jgi:uncharacterized protein YceK